MFSGYGEKNQRLLFTVDRWDGSGQLFVQLEW